MSTKDSSYPSDAPPSYDEALRNDQLPPGHPSQHPQTNTSSSPFNHNQYARPPPQPPRRPLNTSASSANTPDINNLYTANHTLPFRYPKGYLCRKCKNTGFKVKNGKSCKDCWERFGPKNNHVPVRPVVQYSTPSYNPFFFGSSFNTGYQYIPVNPSGPIPHGVSSMPPRVVRPGDPSIGGVLCGRCRGTGITHFILDEETCNVCRGVGRVFV